MIGQLKKWRAAAVAGALVAASCAPPPGGAPPVVWTDDFAGGPTVAGVTPQRVAVGSNASWYVQVDADNSGSPSMVNFYPRVGTNGNALGAPQTLLGGAIGLGGGFLAGDIYLGGSTPTSGGDLQFYYATAGTWATAGTFAVPADSYIKAITDDTLMLIKGDGSINGEVLIYDLAVVAGVVTPTFEASFTAPPAWGANYAVHFGAGTGAALEGDVFAVASRDLDTNGPGRVAIYRNVAGTWGLEDTLVGVDNQFGRSLAIDDLGTTERLAVGIVDHPNAGSVEIFESSGSTWSFDQAVNPPGGITDTLGGTEFGDRVSLDGNLLVVGVHREPLPNTAGGDPRDVLYHSVFHLDAGTWTYETSLKAISTPLDPDDLNRGPLSVIVHENHVVGTSFVSLPGGCMFCFNLRFEAWRWDRSPLP